MGKRTDLLGNECKPSRTPAEGCGCAAPASTASARRPPPSSRRAFASRRTEATGASKSSSRSHAVVMLRPPSAGLLLVDCAGSEGPDSSEHSAARRRRAPRSTPAPRPEAVRAQARQRTRNGRAHVPTATFTRIRARLRARRRPPRRHRMRVARRATPSTRSRRCAPSPSSPPSTAPIHRGAAGRPPQGGGVSARRAATGVRAIVYTNFTSGRSRQLTGTRGAGSVVEADDEPELRRRDASLAQPRLERGKAFDDVWAEDVAPRSCGGGVGCA